MASSRCLLLLLLHLLVFAATAATEIRLRRGFLSLIYFNNGESIERIAKYGYQAYKDAQKSQGPGSDLPPLINERWIDVGIQLNPVMFFARRLCVIFQGEIPEGQIKLNAIVRVTFSEQYGLTQAFKGIDQRSIRVDKIEYHLA